VTIREDLKALDNACSDGNYPRDSINVLGRVEAYIEALEHDLEIAKTILTEFARCPICKSCAASAKDALDLLNVREANPSEAKTDA
jgi:hypothetical protein